MPALTSSISRTPHGVLRPRVVCAKPHLDDLAAERGLALTRAGGWANPLLNDLGHTTAEPSRGRIAYARTVDSTTPLGVTQKT